MPTGDQLPAHVRLMPLIASKWLTAPLAALVELQIFNRLGDHPDTPASLARACGVDADRLHRLLRAVEALGVVTRDATGRYWLTELGRPLRGDEPCSIESLTRYLCAPATWDPFARLGAALRDDETPFERLHETDLFGQLAADPALATAYQGGWASLTDELGQEAVQLFDFGRWPVLADVGGGHGRMLVHILRANPSISGILVDRPEVLHIAEQALAHEPERDRITLLSGTLPDASLPNADAYLIKNTLHCFSDEKALAMLTALRDVASTEPRRRVLVIDTVVPEDDSYHWSKFIDIEVMVTTGGRERTQREWEELSKAAGLKIQSITELTPPQSLLELRPAAPA